MRSGIPSPDRRCGFACAALTISRKRAAAPVSTRPSACAFTRSTHCEVDSAAHFREGQQRTADRQRVDPVALLEQRLELRQQPSPEALQPRQVRGRTRTQQHVLAGMRIHRGPLRALRQPCLRELSVLDQDAGQVRIPRVHLLGRVARRLALALDCQRVKHDMLQPRRLEALRRQLPEVAGWLHSDQNVIETVALTEPLDDWQQRFRELLGRAVDALAPQRLSPMGEADRLLFLRQVQTHDQWGSLKSRQTTALLLLLAETPPGGGKKEIDRRHFRTRHNRSMLRHGRLTSLSLGIHG